MIGRALELACHLIGHRQPARYDGQPWTSCRRCRARYRLEV